MGLVIKVASVIEEAVERRDTREAVAGETTTPYGILLGFRERLVSRSVSLHFKYIIRVRSEAGFKISLVPAYGAQPTGSTREQQRAAQAKLVERLPGVGPQLFFPAASQIQVVRRHRQLGDLSEDANLDAFRQRRGNGPVL